MIITGLLGTLVASSYKRGYFIFAIAALFAIAYNVVWVGRKHASLFGTNVSRTHLVYDCWSIGLCFIYPITWGLSEGGNIIGSDGEAVFHGVLDILAKPVFGTLLLWGYRSIDPATIECTIC
jgi:bacteriorhodopsin